MARGESELPFERRLRHWLRTKRAAVSILVLAAGFLFTILALGAFTPLMSAYPFAQIDARTDTSGANYDLVFVILGPILIVVGGYLVGAYFYARRRFEHLMLTKSKAEFLRNIPQLEELLWDLTPRDQVRFENKLAEFRLRR
jgi:hypothetical protein